MSGTVDRYFILPRKDIALFQFILEGYEGLATVTTLDPQGATVKVSAMADFSDEVEAIIAAVQKEFFPMGLPARESNFFRSGRHDEE